MAFASVGALGTAQEKSADTSLALVTSATAEVGNLIAVWVAMDNVGTSDADTTQISVTDDAGNEYVRIKERTEASGVAADGVVGAIFVAKVKTQLVSGSTITITSASAVTAKAACAHEFSSSGESFAIASPTTQANGTSDPAAVTISGLTSRSYLWLWGYFAEDVTTITSHDADYTAVAPIATSGGLASTNVGAHGAFRIFTGTTDTVDATASASAQHAQAFAAIYEVDIEDRVTQVVAEVVVAPTDQKARVSQIATEAVVLPTDQKARVTQVVAEVVINENIIPPAPPAADWQPRVILI